MGGEYTYKTSVARSSLERPLLRCKRRYESNIKKDVKQIVCERMDWTQLTQDRVL
jgi:hypothetical protein